jgi:hypothetical protein
MHRLEASVTKLTKLVGKKILHSNDPVMSVTSIPSQYDDLPPPATSTVELDALATHPHLVCIIL